MNSRVTQAAACVIESFRIKLYLNSIFHTDSQLNGRNDKDEMNKTSKQKPKEGTNKTKLVNCNCLVFVLIFLY